jgi:hypothetical protein
MLRLHETFRFTTCSYRVHLARIPRAIESLYALHVTIKGVYERTSDRLHFAEFIRSKILFCNRRMREGLGPLSLRFASGGEFRRSLQAQTGPGRPHPCSVLRVVTGVVYTLTTKC